MIKLYHGSNTIISTIDLTQCNPYKDFGRAFYLTTDENQARSVANARADIFGGSPIVNVFSFDEIVLINGILSFKIFEGYTEEWADFVYKNRDESLNPSYEHSYDVVYGPIANDRVGLQIRNFRLGNIDKNEFLLRLQYMKGITFQYAFCTELAIQKLMIDEYK